MLTWWSFGQGDADVETISKDNPKEAQQLDEHKWVVEYAGGVAVRRYPEISSERLTVKYAGEVIYGDLKGEWLALSSEEGFMPVGQKDAHGFHRDAHGDVLLLKALKAPSAPEPPSGDASSEAARELIVGLAVELEALRGDCRAMREALDGQLESNRALFDDLRTILRNELEEVARRRVEEFLQGSAVVEAAAARVLAWQRRSEGSAAFDARGSPLPENPAIFSASRPLAASASLRKTKPASPQAQTRGARWENAGEVEVAVNPIVRPSRHPSGVVAAPDAATAQRAAAARAPSSPGSLWTHWPDDRQRGNFPCAQHDTSFSMSLASPPLQPAPAPPPSDAIVPRSDSADDFALGPGSPTPQLQVHTASPQRSLPRSTHSLAATQGSPIPAVDAGARQISLAGTSYSPLPTASFGNRGVLPAGYART